jgi:hypothetical protein
MASKQSAVGDSSRRWTVPAMDPGRVAEADRAIPRLARRPRPKLGA